MYDYIIIHCKSVNLGVVISVASISLITFEYVSGVYSQKSSLLSASTAAARDHLRVRSTMRMRKLHNTR